LEERDLPRAFDSIFTDYQAAIPGVAWSWADDVAEHLAQSPFTNAESVRSYTVQYRETDLAFVHRLLVEEGLVYRVNPDSTVVILADTTRAASCPLNPQSAAFGSIKYHRDSATEQQDTIQALGGMRELPAYTLAGIAWDYRAKRSLVYSAPIADTPPRKDGVK
jgi:type VI secretion system secreted protein VgrG